MTLQAELQLLRDTRRLLSDPDRWAKDSFSRVNVITEMMPGSFFRRPRPVIRNVTGYCLAGGMNFVNHGDANPSVASTIAWHPLSQLRTRMARYIMSLTVNPLPGDAEGFCVDHPGAIIHSFNDTHTHREVMEMIDGLIQCYVDEIEREEILELAAEINAIPEPELELETV